MSDTGFIVGDVVIAESQHMIDGYSVIRVVKFGPKMWTVQTMRPDVAGGGEWSAEHRRNVRSPIRYEGPLSAEELSLSLLRKGSELRAQVRELTRAYHADIRELAKG